MATVGRLCLRHLNILRGLTLQIQRNYSDYASVYPFARPSTTAKSQSAKQQRLVEYYQHLQGCNAKDKISSLTKHQRMKYVVYPQTFALNADRWYQHLTKTVYVSGLPEKYISVYDDQSTGNADSTATSQVDSTTLNEIRDLVTDSLLQEHCHARKGRVFLYNSSQQTVAPFVKNVMSEITYTLAKQNLLLRTSTLDLDPQVNFYWTRGKQTISRGHRRGRAEPIRFQIDDKPLCQLRTPCQLSEFHPFQKDISIDVPEEHLQPNVLPLFQRQYDNSIFLGSKINDPCCYGHTQFHLIPSHLHCDMETEKGANKHMEATLRANGIASLFAWTGAQAMYQGFWSQQDVDRPFTSQAIITDGKHFSFFCYQLNTLALTHEFDIENTRKNLCWGTKTLRLYERIIDDAVIGLNDRVLMLLIQFLLNGASSCSHI